MICGRCGRAIPWTEDQRGFGICQGCEPRPALNRMSEAIYR